VAGKIQVRDDSLWPQHVFGDEALKQALLDLAPLTVISLRINGEIGEYVKMKAPGMGLRPIGPAKERWRALYHAHKGELVGIVRAQ
jgi:hypothetical protein